MGLRLQTEPSASSCSTSALSEADKQGAAASASGFPQHGPMLAVSESLAPVLGCHLAAVGCRHPNPLVKQTAEAGSWRQVGDLMRAEVAALRWPRGGDGVALVEDVVAFLQPYSDRIILDAKTRDVVRRFWSRFRVRVEVCV